MGPRIKPTLSILLLAISMQESAADSPLVADRISQQENKLWPQRIPCLQFKVIFPLMKDGGKISYMSIELPGLILRH